MYTLPLLTCFTNFTKSQGNLLILVIVYIFFALTKNYNITLLTGIKSNYYLFLYNILQYLIKTDYNIVTISILGFIYILFLMRVSYGNLYLLFFFWLWDFNNIYQIKKINEYVHFDNLNLINGLFSIHPLFLCWLYTTIVLIIVFWFKVLFSINSTFSCWFGFNKSYWKYNFILFKCSLISLFVILTGGWWAQQELNWGGWWVWDFIEIINLFFVVNFLYIKHTSTVKVMKLFNINLIFTLIFTLIYYCTRYGLIPSIHAFLTISSNIQYDFFFFLLIYMVLALLNVQILKNLNRSNRLNFLFNRSFFIYLNNFYFSCIYILIIYIIFTFIISLNLPVMLIFFIKFLIILVSFLIFSAKFLLNLNKILLLFSFFNFCDYIIYTLFSTIQKSFKKHITLHFLIILMLVYLLYIKYTLNISILSPPLLTPTSNYNYLTIINSFFNVNSSINLLDSGSNTYYFNMISQYYCKLTNYTNLSTYKNNFYCFDFYCFDFYNTINIINRDTLLHFNNLLLYSLYLIIILILVIVVVLH